jgi:hypothetical protein
MWYCERGTPGRGPDVLMEKTELYVASETLVAAFA